MSDFHQLLVALFSIKAQRKVRKIGQAVKMCMCMFRTNIDKKFMWAMVYSKLDNLLNTIK